MIDPSSSVDITPYQYHQYKLPSCNVMGLMQADIGWYAEDNDSNGTFLRIILGGTIAFTLMINFLSDAVIEGGRMPQLCRWKSEISQDHQITTNHWWKGVVIVVTVL